MVGESIKVFVVLQKKATLTSGKILEFCRQSLARHMVPKEIIIVDSLPMNPHGKIIKSALKEMG